MKFSATCVSAALALVIAGCPVTNTPPTDATGGDAWSPATDAWSSEPPTDAARLDAGVDAFVCPDLDGDGETDAACGGLDCADGDATLTSTAGPCGTPTAIRRCVSGMITDVECTGDTPYCDARLGECVENACGDGVMHANEFCEIDAALCSQCREPCGRGHACPVGQTCRASDTFIPGHVAGACIPANLSGAPDGTRCTLDDECYSRYCDPTQTRCVSILDRATCNVAGSRLADDLHVRWSLTFERPAPCRYSCFHQSECGAGASCVLARTMTSDPPIMMTTCLRPTLGSAEFGAECARDTDCATGVCVADRCTRVCRDDADCEPGLPSCIPVDLSEQWVLVYPRPDDWPSPWPLLCAP